MRKNSRLQLLSRYLFLYGYMRHPDERIQNVKERVFNQIQSVMFGDLSISCRQRDERRGRDANSRDESSCYR